MDPKGSAMEDLLRGLSALGPTISELVGQVGELERKVSSLSSSVAQKADRHDVDEMSREIKEWKQELQQCLTKTEESMTDMCKSSLAVLLEEHDLVSTSQMKAYAPSSENLTLLATEVENMGQLQTSVFTQFETLRDSLATKIDKGAVPCIEDFDDKGLLMKTNRVEVPTFEQATTLIERQYEDLELKTKSMQVRLGADMEQLRSEIAGKAEKDFIVSLEQIQEMDANLKNMNIDLQNLRSSVSDVTGFPDMLAKTVQTVEKVQSQLEANEKSLQDQIRGINQILLPVARAVRSLPTVSSAVSSGVGSGK